MKINKNLIFIIGIILILALIIILYFYQKPSNKIIPKNDCDTESYIKESKFEDDTIILIGNFSNFGSTVYNKDKSVVYDPKDNAILKVGQTLTIYSGAVECSDQFTLISLTQEKATLEYYGGCYPPGPGELKRCSFEVINTNLS